MSALEYPTPEKTTQSTIDEEFKRLKEEASGEITYGFTNDYMFRAVFQKNTKALKGLLCAVFDYKPEEILSCEITNPIIPGEHVDNKTCILDIRVCLNGDQKVNLEMQMGNLGNWPKRSVYYLCSMFTDLKKGQDYNRASPCVHVGFVSESPFVDYHEFVSRYYLMNPENNHVYSRDISLIMVDLSQISEEKPMDTEDKVYTENRNDNQGLYQWAKLFKARDWKEAADMAESSEVMKEAVVTLRELSEDEKIKLECMGRILYNGDMSSAREQGVQQGIQIGTEQGVQRGIQIGTERGIQIGTEQGIQIGTQQGIQIGTEQGIQIGTQQGDEQRKVKTIQRMLKAKKYSYEEIAEVAETDVETVKGIMETSD